MYTLVAGYGNVTNGAVYAAIPGVLDQSMTMDANNRFAVPGNWQIVAAYGMGINGTAMRINAPSLRSLIPPEIYPINAAAVVPTLDGPLIWGSRGPRLATAEYVAVEGSRGGAGPLPMSWALWMGPDMTPANVGPTFTIIATAAITLIAGSWVLGTLVFSQVLPAGRYQVVGMGVVGPTSAYARLVFPGLAQFRPGVLVQTTYGDKPWTQDFRMGNMGSMGEFPHNSPPSLEVLGLTAGAQTITAYLDVIKIG